MQITLDILRYVLIGFAFSTAVYWGIVMFHAVRSIRRVPTLRDGLEPDAAGRGGAGASAGSAGSARVCVIVPAHNEEKAIGTLLDHLIPQDLPGVTFVLSLDRCTDATESIIRARAGADPRFEIILVSECPAEWVGKVHAIHVAVSTAKLAQGADVLLFLDADTMPAPSCIRAALSLLDRRNVALLSVLSTLTTEAWFEKVVQPAAGMELLRQYPVVRANSRENPRPFANGQFIMVRRGAYDAIGGHASVKSEVLEDVWLARQFSRNGHACGFIFSGHLLHCRMYDQWSKFRRGWLRIFGECASRKPGRLRRSAFQVRLLGTILPMGAAACAVVGAITHGDLATVALIMGLAGYSVWLTVAGFIYHIGRIPLWAAPSFAVGAWLVGSIMLEAARNYEAGNPVQWGGKAYHRDQR